MTRSQFILGTALLCVSGTLAFFISFREQENSQGRSIAAAGSSQIEARSHRSSPLPLSKRKIERMEATDYQVSVSDLGLSSLGQKIEADSRQRLQKMTDRYQLTANQRREIFPLLVSHHPEFTEGFIVNGSSSRKPGKESLSSEIYPLLDLPQQEAYQQALLADNDWWGDVIGQLREDLDGALDAGEVELITEPVKNPPSQPNQE
jgi:hypothetical protein